MGLSTKKSRSSSTENSTSTTTPNVPSFVSAPSANYYGQVGQLNSSPTAFGANANQRAAFTRAGLLSDGSNSDAISAIRGLLSYQPTNVSAGGANLMEAPDRRNYDAAQYDVGQLRDTDLKPYIDPFQDEVISRSISDLDRFRMGAISGNQAAATQSGAYGGSRHGIADAETNAGFGREAGLLSSNLRSQGFRNAQQMAMGDIGLRAGRDASNTAATNDMRARYAGDVMSAGAANQGAREAATARALQAALANQSADRSGADFRLGAANNLASLGLAGDANERANIGLLGDLGAQERGIALENDPERARIARLAQIQGLLGIDPRMFTSMTTTGNRSASGLNSESDGGQRLMQAAQAVAAFFAGSDRRLKRDAIPIGVDKNGVRWWQFNYHTDALGASPRIGVMADELEEIMPEAVVYGPDGYAKVNYAMLGASSP